VGETVTSFIVLSRERTDRDVSRKADRSRKHIISNVPKTPKVFIKSEKKTDISFFGCKMNRLCFKAFTGLHLQ
jgi:hypothetical protein